jgi:hypothetical protein
MPLDPIGLFYVLNILKLLLLGDCYAYVDILFCISSICALCLCGARMCYFIVFLLLNIVVCSYIL